MKLSIVTILVLAACSAPPGEHVGDTSEAVVAYNTPGPQSNDAGVLGTRDNPFTLIVSHKFTDASHADEWAVEAGDNGTAIYGTFHRPVTLFGVLQYEWIQCGAAGAGC